jgi:ribose 5-phosphate isomerase A
LGGAVSADEDGAEIQMSPAPSTDDQKRRAGEAAAGLVESGMVVGLGTGTTAVWLVRALAARKLDISCVSTSAATEALAVELGIKTRSLDQVRRIDLTIDGADEIGPGLSLIKGGGAALLREKLVWEASARCVVIADAGKCVDALGKFPLPVEVVRFGHQHTANQIADVLADFGMTPGRLRQRDGKPIITDEGHLIYDATCGKIGEPAQLAEALKLITGVVEHGLFLDLADQAIIGTDTGVETVLP